MYHRYFGLQEAPFSISVNPRYLFMSARHRDALAHLLYGVGIGGGFILLTGEVGTGKTTINRCVLEQIPDNTDIAIVLNPALNATELLACVCDELGIGYAPGEQSLKELTDRLHQFLLSNHSNDRNTVLLIDEAQHLSFDVLEQIRLLTNLETNTKKLLQIVLVGQPELRAMLCKPEFRQLAQRITARYQLKPLTQQETGAYIRHRLQVAGLPANQELFPNNVVKRLHKISRGIPRLINVLCDRALLGAYGQNKTKVDMSVLKQAIEEVLGEEDELVPSKPPILGISASIAAATLLGLLIWWQWPALTEPARMTAEANKTSTEPSSTDTPDTDLHPGTTQQDTSSPWFNSRKLALDELLSLQALTDLATDNLCSRQTSEPNDNTPNGPMLICERLQVDTWQDLIEYNQPAVLTLVTPSRQRKYATLIAISDNHAVLSHNGGKQTTVSLDELGRQWTGQFLFVWQSAFELPKPLGLNDSGPMVNWLANQFARIDGQQTLLADNTFNTALTQRVKMFQDEHHLDADGFVGLKTLLKLNETLGIGKTLTAPINTDITPSALSDGARPAHRVSRAKEG